MNVLLGTNGHPIPPRFHSAVELETLQSEISQEHKVAKV